jgi:putative zinc finger/helix-turn-helix YgiT family protein
MAIEGEGSMSEDLCPSCGEGSLQTRLEVRRYGRGIDVTLVDVPVRRCPVCGEELVVIPAIEELHRLIAHDLARRSGRLRSGEIRFLRTYLGYSSADFAHVMGVSPETVSRWESARSPQQMAVPAERLLRLMALQDNPVQSYSLAAADHDGAAKPVTLRLATTPAGWTAVA